MPLDTSIALQAKAPEFNPLQQALQVAQYRSQNLQANKLQAEMGANQAVSRAIQKYTGPDGKVDLAGVQSELSQDPSAGYNLQAATGTNLQQQGQQTSNATGQFALHKDYANTVLQTAQGLLQDSRITATGADYDAAKATDALTEAMNQAEAKGVPKSQALLAVAPFANAVHQPGQVASMLQNSLRGQLGASGQATVAAPSGVAVSDGQTSSTVNTNGLSGLPIGAPIPGTTQTQKIGPSQLQTPGTDANGNPIVITKSPQGTVTGIAGAPVAGQSTPVQPRVIPSTETPESYSGLQKSRDDTNKAASQVNTQHFNNKEIKAILDHPSTLASPTGAGASWIASLSSRIGIPTTGNFATDFGQINHYLALQTQANEKSMGVSSDAGRATAGAATGSTEMTPQALRKATSVNDATATGLSAYNQGQEAAVKTGGIPALRDFQNAWSKYYDTNVLRLKNAHDNNDSIESKDILKELGGTSSAAYKEMRANAKAMDQLKRGIIPTGN